MRATSAWGRALLVSGAVALLVSSVPAGPPDEFQRGRYPIPLSLVEEHAEVHGVLKQAAGYPGAMGMAARNLAALLDPHVEKEQRFALSMLKLLPPLARGEFSPDMTEWLPAADTLRAELATLRREHRAIAAAADQFARTAWAEGHPHYAETCQRILRHARMEEEVLYPAAMVVADYLRLRLSTTTSTEQALTGKGGTR